MRLTHSSFTTFTAVLCLLLLHTLLLVQDVRLVEAVSRIPGPGFTTIETPVLSFELITPHTNSPLNTTSVLFHPGFAGASLPLSQRADGLLAMNVMLPHRSDDITGCSGAWNTTNEFGQSFAGAFIMLMIGSCPSINTYHVAAMTGAFGVIMYGCPTSKPYNCDGRVSFAFSVVPSGSAIPPIFSIGSDDGAAMVQFLQAGLNSATAPPTDSLSLLVKGPGTIVPEERAALVSIMSKSIFGPFYGSAPGADIPPAWSVARFSDPTIDPCLNRTVGIWCEMGHVVVIDVTYRVWQAYPMPDEFGAFTQLRFFSNLVNAFNGPVPASWCNLTNLIFFRLSDQIGGGPSSFPNCIGTAWSQLTNIQFDGGSLTSLPASFSQLTNLEIIRGASNHIQVMPSLVNMTRLSIVDLGANGILQMPIFSPGAINLKQIGLHANSFSAPIAPGFFDGMTSLEIIDLNSNHITGPLPNFIGCVNLQIIDLSSQRDLVTNIGGFNSSMPSSWTQLIRVTELYLQENALLSPVYSASMLSLEHIDLSHNYLTDALPTDPNNTDPGAFIVSVLSPSLITMRLSYNYISGAIPVATSLVLSNTLEELYVDHNQLTAIFNILQTSTPYTTFDFSFNNITLANNMMPPGPPLPAIVYLNLRGNPNLKVDVLPSWMMVGTTFTSDANSTFSCASFVAVTSASFDFFVDPTFWSYQHCKCNQGTFGRPPLCHSVPNAAILNPHHVISSPEVGDDFSALVASVRDVGSELTVPNTNNYSRAFSDSMYGENRLTLGISTVWVVDVTSDYQDDPELYVNAGYQPPVPLGTFTINNTVTTPSSVWTPVRMITIRLHVSATEFSEFEDVISVYEGSSDLKGNRVFTMRGTDTKSLVRSTVYTTSPEYLLQHNASISQISDPRLYEIQVFSSMASVQFTSRAISGLHFYATYSYDFTCPDGYFYNREVTPNQCHLNYEQYHVGLPIRSAVFAVSSLTIVFILFNIVILAVYWNSPIYKAASRIFMAVILVLLLCMGLGSLLYASVPNVNDVGSAICIGRGWLTCLPLTGILGVLLAKTNRLDTIFGATTLQVKKMTDLDIGKTVLLVCSVQIVLLGIYSGLPLSRAQLAIGHGSVSDKLVLSCSQESGFMAWMGVEIAYIACLMFPAVYLGYKTRNLPSQYNESSHIQNAIVLLIFFGIIIVPLDIFIQDSPDAAVLIQGLGQAFLCCVMTLIIFGPKLYFLFQFDHSKESNPGTRFTENANTKASSINQTDHNSHTPSTQAQPGAAVPVGNSGKHRVSGINIGSATQSPHRGSQMHMMMQPPQPRLNKQPLPVSAVPTTPKLTSALPPLPTTGRRPSLHQIQPPLTPVDSGAIATPTGVIPTPTHHRSPTFSETSPGVVGGLASVTATTTPISSPQPNPMPTSAPGEPEGITLQQLELVVHSSTPPSSGPPSSESPPQPPMTHSSTTAMIIDPSQSVAAPPRRVVKIHHTMG